LATASHYLLGHRRCGLDISHRLVIEEAFNSIPTATTLRNRGAGMRFLLLLLFAVISTVYSKLTCTRCPFHITPKGRTNCTETCEGDVCMIVVNKYFNGTIIAGCINLHGDDKFHEGPAACYREEHRTLCACTTKDRCNDPTSPIANFKFVDAPILSGYQFTPLVGGPSGGGAIDTSKLIGGDAEKPKEHGLTSNWNSTEKALSAATATVGTGFLPNSLHSYFVQSGNVNMPILYMVDRIRDGRSFCTRLVKAVQNGEAIFTVQISFHKPEADSIVHQVDMPKVIGPERSFGLESANGRSREESSAASSGCSNYPLQTQRNSASVFQNIFCKFLPVDVNSFLFQPSVADGNKKPDQNSFRSYMWIKANENIGDDPRLHVAAAAYISDATMIETAVRPHS
ncbi:putative acyl-CoA thioesterase II, partial [Cooperia oncophora]